MCFQSVVLSVCFAVNLFGRLYVCLLSGFLCMYLTRYAVSLSLCPVVVCLPCPLYFACIYIDTISALFVLLSVFLFVAICVCLCVFVYVFVCLYV